jgi:hypothetical protein
MLWRYGLWASCFVLGSRRKPCVARSLSFSVFTIELDLQRFGWLWMEAMSSLLPTVMPLCQYCEGQVKVCCGSSSMSELSSASSMRPWMPYRPVGPRLPSFSSTWMFGILTILP